VSSHGGFVPSIAPPATSPRQASRAEHKHSAAAAHAHAHAHGAAASTSAAATTTATARPSNSRAVPAEDPFPELAAHWLQRQKTVRSNTLLLAQGPHLYVHVERARNLLVADVSISGPGSSDPYCVLSLVGRTAGHGHGHGGHSSAGSEHGGGGAHGHAKGKAGGGDSHLSVQYTSVIQKNLNPVWNESFAFDVDEACHYLKVDLFDKDRVGKYVPLCCAMLCVCCALCCSSAC
jgi:hypothetical protein